MLNCNPHNQTRLREITTQQTSSTKNVTIVYQESCPHCESLLSRLDSLGLKVESLRVSTPIGMAYAKASKSKTVPIAVFKDYSDMSQTYASLDLTSEDELIAMIIEYLQST